MQQNSNINKIQSTDCSNFGGGGVYGSVNSSASKKLSFSIQSKPFGLMNKKINMSSNNNNLNNIYNNNQQYIMNHNLPKFSQKKSNENITLLEKIKDKVIKENKENKSNNKIQTTLKTNKEKNNKVTKNITNNKTKENCNENKIINEDMWDKGIDEKINYTKKEKNEEEEEILSEELDEMEVNSTNKIPSISVHQNFIKTHYNCESGFSVNSNNSNSNNSSSRKKCFTDPDILTNYSGNINMAQSHPFGGGGQENFSNILFQTSRGFGYPFKSSFLSTNTNSNNQSGQKIDSSPSNESGKSAPYLDKFNKLQYNNSMVNIDRNNTFVFPFTGITPEGIKHIYTNNFNSNERLFRQPFSSNRTYYKKIDNKFNNNFNNSKKEKQVINLEDIALGKETRTTVMIRNIPIKYNDEHLEKELELFEGKYDCLYMPFDYEKGGNKGYAFLNLKSPYHVLLFHKVFCNKCWMFFESKKMCELNFANFQGIDEIKKHAKNYKGSKKPRFYINTNNENNNIIEIPSNYLQLLLKTHPNMKFVKNKQNNTIIVNSFE